MSHRDRLPVAAPRPLAPQSAVGDRIAAIVELGAATVAAERCALAFRSTGAGADNLVRAPRGDSRWDAAVNASLAALENRISDVVAARGTKRARDLPGSIESADMVALSPREIAGIANSEKIDERRQLAASAFIDRTGSVRIAIVAPSDRARAEIEALLGLVACAALGELALSSARASLEFWRTHGAESGRQAVGAKRELDRARAATNYLDNAIITARHTPLADRFARFGEIVASGSGFDQWIVAVADGDNLTLAASSSGVTGNFDPAGASALSDSYHRRIVIGHWRDRDEVAADHVKQYFEDAIFGGPYVCIPFEAGAIALASRDSHASAAMAEAIVERLTPLATSWMLEREAARRNRLVRQLALRMFSAIDEERARIARDLHDDQAQLIAAARIALDGPREAARPIFKQVEDELRRKTRELRPASLANATLDDAIEHEFQRMSRAGVKAKFVHLDHGATDKVSRPVQQLCFQVVREALSNVLRHARAKSVQIMFERINGTARVSVTDDGRGIGNRKAEGTGLTGLRERLELMGGRLTVESRAGRTTVLAEIPESE